MESRTGLINVTGIALRPSLHRYRSSTGAGALRAGLRGVGVNMPLAPTRRSGSALD